MLLWTTGSALLRHPQDLDPNYRPNASTVAFAVIKLLVIIL